MNNTNIFIFINLLRIRVINNIAVENKKKNSKFFNSLIMRQPSFFIERKLWISCQAMWKIKCLNPFFRE
jgi:hypothetical protein